MKMNRHRPERTVNINNNRITVLTEYAGFWRRTLAALADTLWLGMLFVLSLYLIGSQEYNDILSQNIFYYDWKLFIIKDVIPSVIIITLWHHYAATPGKWLVDCEIVDAYTGKPPSLIQLIVRYLAYIVSAAPLGLGFFWILWDKRKQGWHDKIARTVVIVHDDATIPLEQLMKITVK